MTDTRWENVYCYIGPRRLNPYASPEEWKLDDVHWEFHLETELHDKRWFSRQLLHKDDASDLISDAESFAWMMEQMISLIEDYAFGRRTDEG